MKAKSILLITSIFFCVLSCTQQKEEKEIIELPLSIKTGYGPFHPMVTDVSTYSYESNNPWGKTNLKVAGIPKNWTDIKVGDVETNFQQSIYQNYWMGNISKEQYEYDKKSWNQDTKNYSKKPIKCKIAVAWGKDASGQTKMVVDANNNLDFSDDKEFTPFEDSSNNPEGDNDSLIGRHSITVSYERLLNNKIVMDKVRLFIIHIKAINRFMYNFSEYAIAQIDDEEIAVCPSVYCTEITYAQPIIVQINDSIRKGKKANKNDLVSLNEYFKLKSNLYKFKGVNRSRNLLILEKTNLPQKKLCSTQIGFKPFPFQGSDFKSKSIITLDNYKGKYLLIDFWAVWCGICKAELPELKTMYDKLDKSKIDFLGIVGQSSSDALGNIIDKYSITWPQVLSDDKNEIIKKYAILGYPTNFLINPDGVIVAKNLRGKNLENKLNELIKK